MNILPDINYIDNHLLFPFNLTLNKVLSQINLFKCKDIDFGDLYLQKIISENWFLEHDTVKHNAFNIDQGVSARSVYNGKTGLSYSNDISVSTIQKLINTSSYLLNTVSNIKVLKNFNHINYRKLYSDKFIFNSITSDDKIFLLHQINNYAKSLDNRIVQVKVALSGSTDIVLLVNTEGMYAMDVRPLVRINITLIINHNNIIEQFSSGGGGRYDYQYFLKKDYWKQYVDEAYFCICKKLLAKSAPSGSMPVILGHGWPAILLHEAVGHGLEGDFNRKLISHYSDKLGSQVASQKCTVIDEGCINFNRGSLNIDDEGIPTRKTILIKNGVLTNYIHDKISAQYFNVPYTGNGRRESYAYAPLPRMTNTYMLSGADKVDDMIASIDHGIYALHFNGGQVDITSGQFVFVSDYAFLIKNGKIEYPIKGVSLIGNGSTVMQNISMVGEDFSFDSGVGTCSKEGQCVPVSVGQPTLKIDDITVGGS